MSQTTYEKTTWEAGSTALSAENFNHLEKGVEDAHEMLANIFNAIYPVGSIYMSAELDTPTKVMEKFGGTWVAWGQGRVPVGVGTSDRTFAAGETGGSSNAIVPSHTHTATFAGTAVAAHTHTGPSHTHTMAHTHTGPSHTHGLNGTNAAASSAGAHTHTGPSHTHSFSATTGSAGAHTHATNSDNYERFVITKDTSGTAFYKTTVKGYDGASSQTMTYLNMLQLGDDITLVRGSVTGSAGAHTHSVSGTTSAAGTGATGSAGAHSHSLVGSTAAAGTGNTGAASNSTTSAAGTGNTGSAGGHTPAGTVTVASNGESATDKNLQPYITCFMFKRIA